MKRKIAAVVLVGLLSFVTMASTGCAAERASYFTEEEQCVCKLHGIAKRVYLVLRDKHCRGRFRRLR